MEVERRIKSTTLSWQKQLVSPNRLISDGNRLVDPQKTTRSLRKGAKPRKLYGRYKEGMKQLRRSNSMMTYWQPLKKIETHSIACTEGPKKE